MSSHASVEYNRMSLDTAKKNSSQINDLSFKFEFSSEIHVLTKKYFYGLHF